MTCTGEPDAWMPERGPQVGVAIEQRLPGRLEGGGIDRALEVEGMLDGVDVDALSRP